MRSFLHFIGLGDLLGPILGPILWWPILLFVAAVAVYIFIRRKLARKTDDVTLVRLPFLSKAEVMFLVALESSVGPEYRVLPRVRLRDLSLVNCEHLSRQTRRQYRTSLRTVDFVLGDPL